MNNKINRRFFLKSGALIGAGALIKNNSSELLAKTGLFKDTDKTVLSVANGLDFYSATQEAVKSLGGMKKFVTKGDVIGLLVNSRYNKPGTFVKPEITLAVINMCLAAGAKKIISLESVRDEYWRLSSFSKKHEDAIKSINSAGYDYKEIKIKHAVSLKKAEVEKSLLECDVFINVPIFKQHEGIKVTGCLKNLMGLTSHETNQYFHFGSNASDWYSDIKFLSQCIADINLVRKADLCIADATEYITTNGPFGPGKVVKSNKVIAGTDIVAVDSWGAKLLGHLPADIVPIKMAADHKLGLMEMSDVKIIETGA